MNAPPPGLTLAEHEAWVNEQMQRQYSEGRVLDAEDGWLSAGWFCRTCHNPLTFVAYPIAIHLKLAGVPEDEHIEYARAVIGRLPYCKTCETPPQGPSTCIHVPDDGTLEFLHHHPWSELTENLPTSLVQVPWWRRIMNTIFARTV